MNAFQWRYRSGYNHFDNVIETRNTLLNIFSKVLLEYFNVLVLVLVL